MTELEKAISITAELCGTNLSEAAGEMLADELEAYDLSQVMGALAKCRKELKTRLTMAAIIERLDDGRPGPEEAWAMLPMQESQSTVWTAEMAQAFGVAYPLITAGELIPARMAFKESYLRLVTQARDDKTPVDWCVTLGEDKSTHESILRQAVAKGRLKIEYAQQFYPHITAPEIQILLIGKS